MTTADHLFHNIYLLQEVFSCAQRWKRYCEIRNGMVVAQKGVTKLLQLKANYENDLSFTADVMDCAAHDGHLDTIKWLHANRKEGCTAFATRWAAGHGHLHIVQWLHANREEFYCGTSTARLAAANGHLHIIQWLYDNRNTDSINLTPAMNEIFIHFLATKFFAYS